MYVSDESTKDKQRGKPACIRRTDMFNTTRDIPEGETILIRNQLQLKIIPYVYSCLSASHPHTTPLTPDNKLSHKIMDGTNVAQQSQMK